MYIISICVSTRSNVSYSLQSELFGNSRQPLSALPRTIDIQLYLILNVPTPIHGTNNRGWYHRVHCCLIHVLPSNSNLMTSNIAAILVFNDIIFHSTYPSLSSRQNIIIFVVFFSHTHTLYTKTLQYTSMTSVLICKQNRLKLWLFVQLLWFSLVSFYKCFMLIYSSFSDVLKS